MINVVGVTGFGMFCGVMENTELYGRCNNHLLQLQMVWPIVYDVCQMFYSGVADVVATCIECCLEDVMPKSGRWNGYYCIRVTCFNLSSMVLNTCHTSTKPLPNIIQNWPYHLKLEQVVILSATKFSVFHNTTEHTKPCDSYGVNNLLRLIFSSDLMRPCWCMAMACLQFTQFCYWEHNRN